MKTSPRQTVKERFQYGKSLREQVPRSSHGEWSPASERSDPVRLIEGQNEARLDWLVPVRRRRMMASPFAFYRAGARIMAADLASTPGTGVTVQACGDAHLANFGAFASPERQLVFDINDFDETLAGPWEWDVKRLATSFTIAARHNGIDRDKCRKVTEQSVRAYRTAMHDFAGMRYADAWYALLTRKEFVQGAERLGRKAEAKRLTAKAKTKHSDHALDKLAEEIDGEYRIKSEPPLLIPLREIDDWVESSSISPWAALQQYFEAYQESVSDDCKRLLGRFRPVDAALKVVGVGSVGTWSFIVLLEGRDRKDPLFLQIKQATRSVIEEHLSPSPYHNQGQRVVEGQRLMQTVSDIFLGWIQSPDTGQHYYWRQLRDWKGSADVENAEAADLGAWAQLCGWTLARAHARSGDPVTISGYLGSSSRFDRSLTDFAERYADQNQRDYEAFMKEIQIGRLVASAG